MFEQQPAGAILAGGRSTRMGESFKALVELHGRPLLQHVIGRLQPQVSQVRLSVEQYNPALDVFGLAQVEDPRRGNCGPLGGLLASLKALPEGQDWLLLLPCDAPFLPLDLGRQLYAAVLHEETMAAVVNDAGQLQPTFSLWNRSLVPSMQHAVLQQGKGGFMQYLAGMRFSSVLWNTPGSGDQAAGLPFFNINTPADLRRAESVLSTS